MSGTSTSGPKRILEPVERISEFLFGLIMVLTLTCTFSASGTDRNNVRTMLMEALGCNVAWGIIDAFFYLLNCLGRRGRGIALLRQLQSTSDPDAAMCIVGDALPPLIAALLRPHEFESLRRQLTQLHESAEQPRLTKEDWMGALGIFLLVFLSMLPVAVPFIFIGNAQLALRISNGIAIVLLFLAGHLFGHFANTNPWRAGFAMVVIGVAIVGVTIRLGG